MTQIGPYKLTSPYILAPMAGVSEMPFRVIAMEYGAGLATTELVSAKGILYGSERTQKYLTHDKSVEFPFSVQLFGGEPEIMAEAALHAVKMGAHIIDINMGCPVKKVTKTGAGSALMCDPKRAGKIIEQIRSATGNQIPVTAKIRAGWDANTINAVEMAQALEQAGAAALAIHPRTRAQGYSGNADWSIIADVKKNISIPLIGNGDVHGIADAQKLMALSGCELVMIGRAALGNPWIFRALNGKPGAQATPQERQALILRHLQAHRDFHEDDLRAIRSFRTHLVWYSRGLIGASAFRMKAMGPEDPEAVIEAINEFFSVAVKDATQKMQLESSELDDDDGVNYQQAFG